MLSYYIFSFARGWKSPLQALFSLLTANISLCLRWKVWTCKLNNWRTRTVWIVLHTCDRCLFASVCYLWWEKVRWNVVWNVFHKTNFQRRIREVQEVLWDFRVGCDGQPGVKFLILVVHVCREKHLTALTPQQIIVFKSLGHDHDYQR